MGKMKKTRKKEKEIEPEVNSVIDVAEPVVTEEPAIDLIQHELDRYISGITETDETKRQNIIKNLTQYYNALRKAKE